MANQNENPIPSPTTDVPADTTAQTATLAEHWSPNMLQQAHHYVSIKLTSTNYLFWRAQLVPFLRGQNLYGFVDGTNACPSEFISTSSSTAAPTPNPLHAIWVQQDQSILSMLILSLAEEVMYLAIGHTTSKFVWVAVETALGSFSRARSLSLLSQLQNLRQEDMTPTAYLGKAQVLVE
ncbi:PREDICTED: uncharacterized protein LOC109169487 [Ipomoea nil]|uniref:uncharacterized protein LOC109169487 n=1 Tax=Ipomoea nil TaxID=35883 RepID=UPI000901298B|nr:PREDICTED: uncharacterized protein LOC109169487 [Ipomoea nil]